MVTAHGAGLVDFTVIPHLDHEDHPDASLSNAEAWVLRCLPVPTYAIDDQTAITVIGGTVEVVSQGHWGCSPPRRPRQPQLQPQWGCRGQVRRGSARSALSSRRR